MMMMIPSVVYDHDTVVCCHDNPEANRNEDREREREREILKITRLTKVRMCVKYISYVDGDCTYVRTSEEREIEPIIQKIRLLSVAVGDCT